MNLLIYIDIHNTPATLWQKLSPCAMEKCLRENIQGKCPTLSYVAPQCSRAITTVLQCWLNFVFYAMQPEEHVHAAYIFCKFNKN